MPIATDIVHSLTRGGGGGGSESTTAASAGTTVSSLITLVVLLAPQPGDTPVRLAMLPMCVWRATCLEDSPTSADPAVTAVQSGPVSSALRTLPAQTGQI